MQGMMKVGNDHEENLLNMIDIQTANKHLELVEMKIDNNKLIACWQIFMALYSRWIINDPSPESKKYPQIREPKFDTKNYP